MIDIDPYLYAAWQIRDAMPQAISIDNYIDAHRGNEKIEIVGKLGIVQSIIEAEKNSKMYFSLMKDEKLNFGQLNDAWYNSLNQLLTEGVTLSKVDKIFDNISFITFNYDRCIEHYLLNALRNYYALSEDKATELVRSLRVFHPYGVVGKLPWQNGSGEAVGFGSPENIRRLLPFARQIKTFTERVEDDGALAAIRREVAEAEVIVFLGFAFHQQNMELINPGGPTKAKRVFATALGISPSDCQVVNNQILKILDRKPQHIEIELRNNLTCAELFREYWRSLTLV